MREAAERKIPEAEACRKGQEKILDTRGGRRYTVEVRAKERSFGMEKIVAQGMLYDFYGSLLTKHQQEVYEHVVYDDMSLNEIAEAEGISKQAVSDLIRRTTAQMEKVDGKLQLISRYRTIRSLCTSLQEAAGRGALTNDLVMEKTERILQQLQ